MSVRLLLPAACILCLPLAARGAEVVTIAVDNHTEVAPTGKEADWIYGDHVLRNEQLVAVVGRPVATRNANMTVRGVGGCLIDLTSRGRPNDQLSCYYPAAGQAAFRSATAAATDAETGGLTLVPPAANGDLAARGRRVRLECDSEPAAGKPQVAVA